MGMTTIAVSGPIISENGNLLTVMEGNDCFYKIPGGTVELGESPEDACLREAREEINAEIKIVKPLHPMILWKNPQTRDQMCIVLLHYKAELLNNDQVRPVDPVKELKWIPINKIREHNVAPNIKFLLERGDIK